MKKILIVINFALLCLIGFKHYSLADKKYVVFIDPGHGGFDSGAVSDTLYEKDLTLSISLMLKDLLEDNGIEVIMSRETDKDLSSENSKNKKVEDIRKRTQLINDSKADIYVSIHINSGTSKVYRGAQTFYSPKFENNKILAKDIQDYLRDLLKNTTRRPKEINNVYIVKNANIVGCLVECGFISNEAEKNLLATKEYQAKVADAIYLGILKYLKV